MYRQSNQFKQLLSHMLFQTPMWSYEAALFALAWLRFSYLDPENKAVLRPAEKSGDSSRGLQRAIDC